MEGDSTAGRLCFFTIVLALLATRISESYLVASKMALGSENDIDQLEVLLLPIYIANEHKDANEQEYAAMVWRTRIAEMNESSRAINCVHEGIAVRSVLD